MKKKTVTVDMVPPDQSRDPYRPCNHPGCTSHHTHPCEGCGRQWGPRNQDT